MRLEPGRHRGFLEMHIEQGTQLEQAGLRIGVVSGIVAIWQWRIVVRGNQDHAGGTTMAERKDAGLTAVRLLAAIDDEFPRVAAERSTWTTGSIVLTPGAPSIIPGTATILFQFRDVSVPVLERMEAALRALVREANRRERCAVSLEAVSQAVPALCDPALMAACRRRPRPWPRGHGRKCRPARDMTRRISPGTCRPPCCSCRRSAASATTGLKTPRTRTWRSVSGCLTTPHGGSWRGEWGAVGLDPVRTAGRA